MKATTAAEAKRVLDIPNVGPAIAVALGRVGVNEPEGLKNADAFALYQKLNRITNKRYDPCVLDTFMAAIDFMNGAPVRPWWSYTKSRKEKYGQV